VEEEPPRPEGEPARRIVLVKSQVSDAGMAATVEVEVQYGEHRVAQKVVGRNAADRIPFLVGEATARAVTGLLPAGYGVVLHDIHAVAKGEHEALWAAVILVTPDGEEKLLGIAAPGEDSHLGIARAVLNAINRRITQVLGAVA